MRIAICDDSVNDRQKIEYALSELSNGLEIVCFNSGTALLESVNSGTRYELIFAGTELTDGNGLDFVRAVQRTAPETQVVITSSSRDYAVDAFDVNAIGYLVKPYDDGEIVKTFARASIRNVRSEKAVLIKSGSYIQVFRPIDVKIIESDRHYTKITTVNDAVCRFHLSFSEVMSKFPDSFIEISRGLAVNMMHIEKIKGSFIFLDDGSCYSMSKLKKDDVIKTYVAFADKRL